MKQHSEITEKEVLSATLTSPDKLSLLMAFEDDIFHFSENKSIFIALKELYEDDIPVDSSSLTIKLKEHKKFDQLENHLIDIYKSHSPVSIGYHLNQLAKLSRHRKLMIYLKDAYAGIKNNDVSYQQFIDKIIEVNDSSLSIDKEYITVKEMSGMDLDSLYTQSKFVKSGIGNLDEKLYGLRDGQLIIIAGRPGMGKSTLALQIAKNIKHGPVFFSLEMDKDELYLKMLSNQSQVDSNKIEQKKMSDEEMKRVMLAHELYCSYDMVMIDKIFTLSAIRNKIRLLVKSNKCDIVFIDYLQLMAGGTGDTKDQKIGSITRTLKLLAKELDIPIVLLSQLSRDLERNNRQPVLSDLRESGNIEQDADVVIFAHEKDEKCLLIIAKNRKGRTGSIESVVFEKEFSRFRDAEQTFEYESPDYIHN